MIPHRAKFEIMGLVAGFTIWSLAFVGLYGGHGLACSLAVEEGATLTRELLLAVWAAMLMAEVALIVWFVRRFRAAPTGLHFIRLASLTLATAALGATIWTGVPVVFLEIC